MGAEAVDRARLEAIGREVLIALGEDPEREGLRETPRRWAKMWADFIEYDPGKVATAFESITADQLVLVEQIAADVETLSGSPDVAVIARGVHTCMVMRGVRTEGVMTSSVMRGLFREEASARAEFLALSGGADAKVP